MKKYLITPNKKVKLSEYDPDDHSEFEVDKEEAKSYLPELNRRIETLQEMLYAENKHKILIVLQAMDTGGKDGTIRYVFDGVNPQGVRVANFKVPTDEEMAHDYLWRVHKQTPRRGEIVIFNRSHYEDVLVVRVHKLVAEDVWKRRFEQINNFEKLLFDEGTTIIKFFLNIDQDEQKQRLQSRLDNPNKHWKFNVKDLDERKLWDKYIEAYEDVLSKTSTKYAPWYVVPANRKWYRNLVVAKTIIDKLESLNIKYPTTEDLSNIIIE